MCIRSIYIYDIDSICNKKNSKIFNDNIKALSNNIFSTYIIRYLTWSVKICFKKNIFLEFTGWLLQDEPGQQQREVLAV